MNNVSEKKYQEELKRLQEENRKLQNLIQNSTSSNSILQSLLDGENSLIFYTLDKDYRYSSFNDKHKEFARFLFNKEPQLGESYLDYVPEFDKERAKKALDDCLNGNQQVNQIMGKNYLGQDVQFTVILNPIIENEKITGISSIIKPEDNSFSKFEFTKKELQNIIDKMPVGVAVLDKEKKIHHVNEELLKIADFETVSDLIGKQCTDTICFADCDKCPVFDLNEELDKKETFVKDKQRSKKPVIKSAMNILINGKEYLLETYQDISQQKEIQRQLSSAEDYINNIFNKINEGLLLLDFDRNIIRSNSYYKQHFENINYKNSKTKLDDLIFDTDVLDHYWDLAINDLESKFELVITNQDKSKEFNVVCILNKILFDHEEKMLATITDISERKKEESHLKYLGSITENIMDSVIAISQDIEITYVNRNTFKYTGYRSSELMGKSPAILFREKDRENLVQEIGKEISENGFFLKNIVALRKDGSTFDAELRIFTMHSPENELLGYISIVRDITAKLKAQNLLRESENKYRSLLNNMHDGFMIVDNDGIIKQVNEATLKILGYDNEELVGLNFRDITPDVWISDEIEKRYEKVNDIGFSGSYEKEYIAKDGSFIPVELQTYKYSDLDGNQLGYWTLIRDISFRKKWEDDVNKLNRTLEKRVIERTSELNDAMEELKFEMIERKRTEIELLKITAAVENSPISVIVTDLSGIIEYVNPFYSRITGYKADKVIGKHCMTIKSKFVPENLYDEMISHINDGKIWRGEFPNNTSSGKLYYESATISSIKDASSNVHKIIAVKEDITVRRSQERKIRKSEEQFRSLVNNTPDTILMINRFGDILFSNKQITQIDDSVLRKNNVYILTPELYRNDLKNTIEKAFKTGTPQRVEIESQRSDGSDYCFEARIAPIKNDDIIEHLMVITSETTERIKMEKMLRDASERWELAVSAAKDGIWDWNIKTNELYLSPSWKSILGYQDHEMDNNWYSFEDNIYKEDAHIIEDAINSHFSRKTTDYYCEFRMRHKQGFLVWIASRGQAIWDDDGEPYRMVGMHTDISERKQNEDDIIRLVEELKIERYQVEEKATELRKLNEELFDSGMKLKELNASKDKFFSIISHDLRGPFSGFLGLSELIAEEYEIMEKDDIASLAKTMNKGAQQLFSLLENLLEWSRTQTGTVSYNPRKIDLNKTLNESRKLFESAAKNKEISLVYDVDKEMHVYADNNMLNTILRNLINNAIKFTNRNGNISIKAEKKDKNIIVSVQDDGVGMNKETVKSLFRIDQKNSNPGTEKEKGTGLGLILCREYIEKNGGNIWVESKEGKGSTFYIELNTDKLGI